jgi:hypothetical protein
MFDRGRTGGASYPWRTHTQWCCEIGDRMGYELRTKVVEQKRNTFTHVSERIGDRPASRYQEATLNIQPMEHFPTARSGRRTTSCMTPITPS